MLENARYDNVPDIELLTDESGQVNLGRCPFDEDGTVDHGYGLSNGVIILRVEYKSSVSFHFLNSAEFNIKYWSGNVKEANYEIVIDAEAAPVQQIDLVVSDLNVDKNSISHGEEINISSVITNLGNSESRESRVEFYISENDVFDYNSAELLRYNNVFALKGGASGSTEVNVEINKTEGIYYLFAIADADNANEEVFEKNNISKPIQ